MPDETPPALSPDEWARGIVDRPPYAVTLGEGRMVLHGVGTSVIIPDELRHPLAALCLDGQGFGFTPEMANDVLQAATLCADMANWIGKGRLMAADGVTDELRARERRLLAVAARIAALLPKETTHA